jgi:hypothetical protein
MDHTTGAFPVDANDGLYWRLSHDSASDWFGFIPGNQPVTLNLPMSGNASGQVQGPLMKLAKGAGQIRSGIFGELTYSNRLLLRQVSVKLAHVFHVPGFLSPFLSIDGMRAEASSAVVDPVELIRTVDLARSYTTVIKGKISPADAKKALIEPEKDAADGAAVRIKSEKEAASYLRKLTSGSQKQYALDNGSTRIVDALDANGIAHQAFFTYTEGQLRSDQLPKDVKLLRSGQVKGVVWHFFVTSNGDQAGPSAALRKELESKGIVVVIHH